MAQRQLNSFLLILETKKNVKLNKKQANVLVTLIFFFSRYGPLIFLFLFRKGCCVVINLWTMFLMVFGQSFRRGTNPWARSAAERVDESRQLAPNHKFHLANGKLTRIVARSQQELLQEESSYNSCQSSQTKHCNSHFDFITK